MGISKFFGRLFLGENLQAWTESSVGTSSIVSNITIDQEKKAIS